MSDTLFRRFAIILTIASIGILLVSAVMLSMAPTPSTSWLYNMVRSIVTIGAPIVGLVIVNRRPRQRIGWLWIFYGLFIGLSTLGHGIYFSSSEQPVGYSSQEYFLLWFTEPAGLITLIVPIFLMLWFPDGRLASRRWRALPPLLFVATTILFLLLFKEGRDWNGGAQAGGIVISNPYGLLPESISQYAGLLPFLTIVLITVLAAASLVFRYREAGYQVRLQLRWFVLGGAAFVLLDYGALGTEWGTGFQNVIIILSASAIVPLYVAVGMAILRYRLYEIDVIIRRTLQYGLLTGLLVLFYFGGIIILQSVLEAFTGDFNSPLIIVITTLGIAALFNPLRHRVQEFIDRRFFRKKYDAEKALNAFNTVARDEVDIERLAQVLLGAIDDTMQPAHSSLWLKESSNREQSDR